jgi:hypothetical protein
MEYNIDTDDTYSESNSKVLEESRTANNFSTRYWGTENQFLENGLLVVNSNNPTFLSCHGKSSSKFKNKKYRVYNSNQTIGIRQFHELSRKYQEHLSS